jgi:plastocyanin
MLLLGAAALLGCLLRASPALAANLFTVFTSPHSPYTYQNVPAAILTGDTVTWVNYFAVEHTVTPAASADPRFTGGVLPGQGSSYSYTFDVPGQYSVYCRIHPLTMRMSLIVVPRSSTLSSTSPRTAGPTPGAPAPPGAPGPLPAPSRSGTAPEGSSSPTPPPVAGAAPGTGAAPGPSHPVPPRTVSVPGTGAGTGASPARWVLGVLAVALVLLGGGVALARRGR